MKLGPNGLHILNPSQQSQGVSLISPFEPFHFCERSIKQSHGQNLSPFNLLICSCVFLVMHTRSLNPLNDVGLGCFEFNGKSRHRCMCIPSLNFVFCIVLNLQEEEHVE